jgi:acetyltransferase-like isoleucine patch superfamily enzyme
MLRNFLVLSYGIIRTQRRLRGRINLTLLRLRGVQVHSTAQINPSAIFEPSGGKIIIGARSYIDHGVVLRALEGTIEIGEDCSVNAYSVLLGGGGLRVGNKTRIAPHCVIVPSNHIFSDPDIPIKDQGLEQLGITIEEDVWIGAGVRVLDGVVLGQGCVVGAGAVVTQSVPPSTVVVGVPARRIATR